MIEGAFVESYKLVCRNNSDVLDEHMKRMESVFSDQNNQKRLNKIINDIQATEQKREAEELINTENLNEEAAKRYILTSLKREFASENGTELNEILPKMSPLNPQYLTKKQSVFQKISAFVDKFKGVGGKI